MSPPENHALNHLRERAAHLSLEQFLQQRPDAVLIFRQLSPLNPAEEERSCFHTGHVAMFTSERAAPPAELVCHVITKRPGAIFGGQLTVGRTRNTDVCINHPKVSKLHAYFTRSGQGAALRYHIVDAGSTNGTWLNGLRLEGDQPRAIADGDSLRFGQPVCAFYAPTGLYHLLRGDLRILRGL